MQEEARKRKGLNVSNKNNNKNSGSYAWYVSYYSQRGRIQRGRNALFFPFLGFIIQVYDFYLDLCPLRPSITALIWRLADITSYPKKKQTLSAKQRHLANYYTPCKIMWKKEKRNDVIMNSMTEVFLVQETNGAGESQPDSGYHCTRKLSEFQYLLMDLVDFKGKCIMIYLWPWKVAMYHVCGHTEA